MNPWISEQLAAAHRADLERLAAGRIYPDRSLETLEARAVRPRHLLAVRVRLGEALIRSGSRLAGRAPTHPLRPAA